MKTSCKSLDVFEFREEDELTEMTARSFASKFRKSHPRDHEYSFLDSVNKGAEIDTKGIDTAMCENVDAADVDNNCAATGSFSPLEIENLDEEKRPGSSNDSHNHFEAHKQASEMKSYVLERETVCPVVGCSLIPVAPACLKDQSKFPFPESSFDDEFVRTSDADENKTSSGGPSSDKCFSGWDLGDDRGGIFFFTDYMYYRGEHYPDSVVSFSRSSVEVKSKTTDETNETFHFQLEIDDIVKIESQWCARLETGIINIFFMSKSITHELAGHKASVSGIHELKFTAFDSDWYEKKEAITSLDVKYKALWNSLLDVGVDECSTLPNWEATFTRSYFPNFDKPFEDVIYPKGDPDAVSISKRDIDLLQPNTFVNDTIIDFYIKYLKNRQNGEERVKFHFFNCFFFRKLADMDKDPSSSFDGKAAFQRVRKWTRKVNLLEKDFIFIPVNYNYHWSLIVVCYFGDIAKDTDVDDKLSRVPCILHMDSFKGTHMGLKDLMQSYLWEEWKERQKETCDDLYSKFRNLKFVSLELPQQQNLYDCGLFLLHYVELFLEEALTDFNVYKITPSSNFLQADWFPPGEASMKRACIERLIHELLENHSEECSSSGESDLNRSPNTPTTANYNGNEQGIEMTLLPATQINNIQCTRNSGLSLKNLFEPGYVSGTFAGLHSRAFEQIESIDELRRPVSQIKEEREAGQRFTHDGLVELSFQHVDELIPRATVFPYPSGEFRLEPDREATLENASLSLAPSSGTSDDVSEVDADEQRESFEAVESYDELDGPKCILSGNIDRSTFSITSVSGELVGVPESCSLVGIRDQNEGSLHLKNLPECCEETDQVQGNGTSSHEFLPSCPPFTSGGTLDDTEDVSPYRIVNSTDQAYPSMHGVPVSLTEKVDGASVSEACEFHAAKKMRFSHPNDAEELTCDLSKDLHL
ncbi:Cysteine protein superfamily protein [Dorcoceras hygrometricum]|uniref:Cysteine protein superfamily protein n=1 Tax=Dorcoceras hygrometricum TaxID=472368 RepID=A0A2Z7BYW2_9LAMI|nr:Cysteine protein superfamily protein [Dorcoceras hygrometricum]